MADEKKNVPAEKAEKKSKKSDAKKENFFVRIWNKFVKLCKDTVGELKKVVWTSKSEVIRSFVLVITTVLGVSLIVAIIDLSAAGIIKLIGGLIG
jgi:preprotein translocase SecE subunit